MWSLLKKLFIKALGSFQNIRRLEKRIMVVEQELEALQTKVEIIDSNVVLILGHPALNRFELEMTRLEKIFNSGADRFLPTTWYWLQKCPNECLLLAKV